MRYFRVLFLFLVALLHSACAPMSRTHRTPPPAPVPQEPAAVTKPLIPPPSVTVQPRNAPAPVPTPAPETRIAEPVPAPAAQPPAVLALMEQAQRSRAAGNLDSAAATLERALRIQPRDAALWHELAAVRLQQHKPRLAEDLAKKSNTLAGHDHALKKKNWDLIARGRRLQGDEEGAQRAQAKAQSL